MSTVIHENLNFLHKNRYFSFPKIMQIEVTTKCPLHCPQCYKNDANPNVMSYEMYTEIVEDAKKTGVGAITLLGGEPLTHPKICEMIYALDKAGIVGGTYTSGYGVNENLISTLRNIRNPFYLFLSLNGSTKRIHEFSRDEFDLTLQTMVYLKEQRIAYAVNWVARHDNISDLPDLIILAKSLDAKHLNVVCNKINAFGFVDSPMNQEDYLSIQRIFSLPENKDFLKFQNCYGLLRNILDISKASILSGCQAGISVCAVDSIGMYRPCLHLNYSENCNSIMDYWRNSPVLKKLRKPVGARDDLCNNCKYGTCCRFCKAMSLETHNNFEKGLPNCPIGEAHHG